jgi:PBP1b-binding outer membrane lipoprotein LpoB
MTLTRKVPAAVLAAAALFATGCKSDEAAKKDIKNATEDVKQAGKKAAKDIKKAGKDAEKSIPGDADDDGK